MSVEGAKPELRPFFFSTGFTLVELVIYMIIASTLAVFAFLSYRPNDVKTRYQVESLRADLRHMQMLAVTRGVRLRLTSAAGNYSVACVGSATGFCATTVVAPCAASIADPATSNNFCSSLQSGLSLSPVTTFDVDSLGRPLTAAGALLATDTVFQITAPGATTYTLTIRPLTGFGVVTP